MIFFTSEQIKIIYEDAGNEYPNECCGILLGERGDNDCRIVKNVLKVQNVAEEQIRSRYFKIHKDALLHAESFAEKNNYEIIGIYHSHTDCEAIASVEDADFAIPGISYPIVSIINGQIKELTSWEKIWTNRYKELKEEKIEIRN